MQQAVGSILLYSSLILVVVFLALYFQIENRKHVKELARKNDHPGRREGEIFIGNFSPKNYWKVNLRTKRIGLNAYDKDGEKIGSFPEIYPVFAKQEEVETTLKKQ